MCLGFISPFSHSTKNSFSCVFKLNSFNVFFFFCSWKHVSPPFSHLSNVSWLTPALSLPPPLLPWMRRRLFSYSPEHLCHKSCELHLLFILAEELLGIQTSRLAAFLFHCLSLVRSSRDRHFYQRGSWLAPPCLSAMGSKLHSGDLTLERRRESGLPGWENQGLLRWLQEFSRNNEWGLDCAQATGLLGIQETS